MSRGITIGQTEADAFADMHEEFGRRLLWGYSDEERAAMKAERDARGDEHVKLAWVTVDGKRVMLGVDNVTYKGYALNETTPEWKLPLEEVVYDKFERWCRLMDL